MLSESVRIQSSSSKFSLANSWNRTASDDGRAFSSAARYRGRDRVATGLCEGRLIVELESRCERDWTRPGRGDFLVAEGERLLVFLGSSRALDACGVSGRSSLAGLSAGLGAVQANLMVHGRFGASFDGASVVAGCDVGGGAGFATASFLPPHANVIHRFLGATGAAGCDFGDMLMPSPAIDSLLWMVVIDGAASM